jgi:hypothetical protein
MILTDFEIEIFLCIIKLNGCEKDKNPVLPMLGALH